MMSLVLPHDIMKERSTFSPEMEGIGLAMDTEEETALRAYAYLMLEHVPAGIALFEAHELRLLAANSRYQSFLEPQWQHGRAIGHPLTEFLPHAERAQCLAIFRQVAQTGIPYRAEADASSVLVRGVKYWNWTLDPIAEHDQVSYLLLTATEVTSEVMARKVVEQTQATLTQTQQEVARERLRRESIETILSSTRSASEPQAFARAVLSALNTCFAPPLSALYSMHLEHHTLSLLASHISLQQEEPLFPAFLACDNERSPVVEALEQHTPLIRRISQDAESHQDGSRERDSVLTLPAMRCVIYLPLWGKQRCEGVLVAAFAREEEANELLVQTLSECAPYLGEALAETRLHAALVDERQRLHTVLDQLPEGIVLVEALTSTVRYANPAAAELLGVALPHLVGAPLNESVVLSVNTLSRPRSTTPWNFALIHALWGKTITTQELVITRPDGREVVVLSSAAPIRASHGRITEAVMVFQDITARKSLEQQKNEFFAVASHELRTPLTIITGFAEILHLCATEEADARSRYAVTSIIQECDHLRRLIDELLDVSHTEHTPLELKRSYQDVLAPLQQMVTKHSSTTNKHRLHLMLHEVKPADRLMGWFDLSRVEQMLNNLLTNAIKYSPAGGEIEVGVQPRRSP